MEKKSLILLIDDFAPTEEDWTNAFPPFNLMKYLGAKLIGKHTVQATHLSLPADIL